MAIDSKLQSLLLQGINTAYSKEFDDKLCSVQKNPLQRFSHHFSSDFAIRIATKWEEKASDIAQNIAAKMSYSDISGMKIIEKIETTKNGYINIFLDPEFVSSYIMKMNSEDRKSVV